MTSVKNFEKEMVYRWMRSKGDDDDVKLVYADPSRSVFVNFSTEEVCKQQLDHFVQDYALDFQKLDEFVPNTEKVQKDIQEWLAMGCNLEQLLDTIRRTHNYGGVSLISEESVLKFDLTKKFHQMANTRVKLVGAEKQCVSAFLLMVEISVFVLDNKISRVECSDLDVTFGINLEFDENRVHYLPPQECDWSTKITVPLMRFVYSSGVQKRESKFGVDLMAVPTCFELDISAFRVVELYEGVFFWCVSQFDCYDYSGYDLEAELVRVQDKFNKLLDSINDYAKFLRLIRDQLNARPWVFVTDKMSCEGFDQFDDMFGDGFIDEINRGNFYIPTYASRSIVTTVPPNCVFFLTNIRDDLEIFTRIEIEWGLVHSVFHFCEDFVFSLDSTCVYPISFRAKQKIFDDDLPVCCYADYSKVFSAFADLGLQLPLVFNFSKLFEEMPPQFIVRQFLEAGELYENVVMIAKHMAVINCSYPYVREKFSFILR